MSNPKAIGASKVSSQYQVTIPAEVRKRLNLESGDTLIFLESNGKVYITTEVKF